MFFKKLKPAPPKIEYKRLDKDRLLVTAHRGKKQLKTIVELFSPEELEPSQNAQAPQGK